MTTREREIIDRMKEVAAERPDTREPSLEFVRDWAFGNAGLEDESITREQVDKVITSVPKRRRSA